MGTREKDKQNKQAKKRQPERRKEEKSKLINPQKNFDKIKKISTDGIIGERYVKKQK